MTKVNKWTSWMFILCRAIFATRISRIFFITPSEVTQYDYSKYKKKRMNVVKLYKKLNLSNNNKPHSCVPIYGICVHIVFHSIFVCEAISMLIHAIMMEAFLLRACVYSLLFNIYTHLLHPTSSAYIYIYSYDMMPIHSAN